MRLREERCGKGSEIEVRGMWGGEGGGRGVRLREERCGKGVRLREDRCGKGVRLREEKCGEGREVERRGRWERE